MAPSTKLEHKLEGIEKFLACKYRIGLILKENGLEKYIKDEVAEPIEDEAKEKHEKYLDDSIKYHLIPQVSSKNTPKQMYVELSRMYREGTSIEI